MEEKEEIDLNKVIVIGIITFLALLAALFFAYRYSQTQSSSLVLPGGITYLGPTKAIDAVNPPTPYISNKKFESSSPPPWKLYKGKQYPYSFSYPEDLKLIFFENDDNDSVAFDFDGMPATDNILLNIENVEKRDPESVGKPVNEYANTWYRFFGGLKGVKSVEKFKNSKGLTGYKAVYINAMGETPNTDIFFEVPKNNRILIHLANGRLENSLFEKIVDSVSYP